MTKRKGKFKPRCICTNSDEANWGPFVLCPECRRERAVYVGAILGGLVAQENSPQNVIANATRFIEIARNLSFTVLLYNLEGDRFAEGLQRDEYYSTTGVA